MKILNNLRIRARLALGFGLCTGLLALTVIIAYQSVAAIGEEVALIDEDRYPKVQLVAEINRALGAQARSARNALLMTAPADIQRELDEVEREAKAIGVVYDRLEGMLSSAEGKAMFATLKDKRAAYRRELDAFVDAARAQRGGAQELLLNQVRPVQLAYMASLDEFTQRQERLMVEAANHADADVERAQTLLLVMLVAAVAVAAAAALVVSRSIVAPLQQAVQGLRQLADGDLTVEVDNGRRDELGELLQALQRTTQSLRDVVGTVRAGVDSVTTAASQIAAGNADLSARTEQQASSLQETAASMEQITGTVSESSGHAAQANQLADEASGAARRGGEVVDRVVGTMDEITGASRRIGDIIGVIDGIAFQTNILALNAAVEAARAGEHGRGFAVVAGEVRTLAQRSADAAREIKGLIGSSVEKVEAGATQVTEAGAAMRDIVAQVSRVSQLINEISAAAGEQSAGIAQVNAAVAHMDQATQQNSALVEESAAAAQSLAQQAQTLARSVAVFKLAA